MRRVHDYDGPSTTDQSPTNAQGQAAGNRKNNPRKRKATADEGVEKKSKAVKITQQQREHQERERQKAQWQQDFRSTRQSMLDTLNNAHGLDDLGREKYMKLTQDWAHLTSVFETWAKSRGDGFGG